MDDAVARLLDANANRAREGLRVIEDHARFVLDDASLAERIKRVRHHLSALCAALPEGAPLAARDVSGDVGREISTDQERQRGGPEAVATAGARRVTEAIRCLEEYTKCVDVALAAKFEAARYEVYELEQRLLIGGPRRRMLRQAALHVLLTESLCRGPWLDTARAAIEGGAGVLQLREKSLSDRMLLERAEALRRLTRELGALLIINDRPDVAKLADADGVHVGQDDLPVEAARRIVGRDRIVGVSTHSVDQFRAALTAAPDYVAVGPMFASRTKPREHAPGPALLAAAVAAANGDSEPHGLGAARAKMPVVSIGGIRPDTVGAIREAGGVCVAVCEAVVAATDPRAAAAALVQGLLGGVTSPNP